MISNIVKSEFSTSQTKGGDARPSDPLLPGCAYAGVDNSRRILRRHLRRDLHVLRLLMYTDGAVLHFWGSREAEVIDFSRRSLGAGALVWVCASDPAVSCAAIQYLLSGGLLRNH